MLSLQAFSPRKAQMVVYIGVKAAYRKAQKDWKAQTICSLSLFYLAYQKLILRVLEEIIIEDFRRSKALYTD